MTELLKPISVNQLPFVDKAKIKLMFGKGFVDRRIYEYEDKTIFKHNGSWHFCKLVNGIWEKYEIRLSDVKILKPQVKG